MFKLDGEIFEQEGESFEQEGDIFEQEGDMFERDWNGTWTSSPGMGSSSFMSSTPSGRSLRYQGCRWMPRMLIRLAGSATNIRVSRSRSSGDSLASAGGIYGSRRILCAPHQHIWD